MCGRTDVAIIVRLTTRRLSGVSPDTPQEEEPEGSEWSVASRGAGWALIEVVRVSVSGLWTVNRTVSGGSVVDFGRGIDSMHRGHVPALVLSDLLSIKCSEQGVFHRQYRL